MVAGLGRRCRFCQRCTRCPGGQNQNAGAHRDFGRWPGRHCRGQPAPCPARRRQDHPDRPQTRAPLPARLHLGGHRRLARGQGARPQRRLPPPAAQLDSGDGQRTGPGQQHRGHGCGPTRPIRLLGGGHGHAPGLDADRGHGCERDWPKGPDQRLPQRPSRAGHMGQHGRVSAPRRQRGADAAGHAAQVRGRAPQDDLHAATAWRSRAR